MATKTVAWNSGSGVITLTYTGQGNGSVSVKSDANESFDARSQNLNIVTTGGSPEKAVQVLVKQAGKPLGWTTKDFDYTGSVQEVTLPKGRYKLQCWGAQGGNVTGAYAAIGSKGGYSEGIITLTETTTLYIYVGGKGTDYTSDKAQTSTALLNGGWNGGGAAVETTYYDDGIILGKSFPRGGGGSTDIATVYSSVGWYEGRTTRTQASLLSRIIVAGGGAGASARYTREYQLSTEMVEELIDEVFNTPSYGYTDSGVYNSSANRTFYNFNKPSDIIEVGRVFTFKNLPDNFYQIVLNYKDTNGASKYVYNTKSKPTLIVPDDFGTLANWSIRFNGDTTGTIYPQDIATLIPIYELIEKEVTIAVETSEVSNGSSQGGGEEGKGVGYGTQTSGTLCWGVSMLYTNRRYAGGAGGGGWRGGSVAASNTDTATYYINRCGGGSGFVNIAANASYRPSGYTGLELDSGSTTAGNSSHPSVSGGTEIGHSGNGYARITVIN